MTCISQMSFALFYVFLSCLLANLTHMILHWISFSCALSS